MNKLQQLSKKNLIRPPKWVPDNTVYLVYTGSMAYGVSSDTSDMDCYGIVVPPKEMCFPHLTGEILGFGRQIQRFETWQEHHIEVPEEMNNNGRTYDFQIYSIIKFFQLAMDNNPNIVDCLFVPHTCVLHTTAVGNLIRENRKIFLHKGCWHKFKGYAFSSLHKAKFKEHKGIKKVEEFEDKHNILRSITLEQVENEMLKRKLLE